MDDETRKLAALAHRIWARWMRAMFAHGEHHDNGTWTMDQHAYRRWTRQMNATYDELHEGERVSDIEVAHEWLEATGVDALRAENARLREALEDIADELTNEVKALALKHPGREPVHAGLVGDIMLNNARKAQRALSDRSLAGDAEA